MAAGLAEAFFAEDIVGIDQQVETPTQAARLAQAASWAAGIPTVSRFILKAE